VSGERSEESFAFMQGLLEMWTLGGSVDDGDAMVLSVVEGLQEEATKTAAIRM